MIDQETGFLQTKTCQVAQTLAYFQACRVPPDRSQYLQTRFTRFQQKSWLPPQKHRSVL
jgi:hypothetical protein